MLLAIGFVIALAVGLTGIGGGSFTVPALILFVGLAPKTAVGTAFIFAGVLRLIVGPLYLWGKNVRGAYVWHLLKGAVPGLLIGTYLLRLLSENETNPVLVIALGVLLGCVLARRAPARNLKSAIALIAILAGLQLVWTGSRSLVTSSAQRKTNSSPASLRIAASRVPQSDAVAPAVPSDVNADHYR